MSAATSTLTNQKIRHHACETIQTAQHLNSAINKNLVSLSPERNDLFEDSYEKVTQLTDVLSKKHFPKVFNRKELVQLEKLLIPVLTECQRLQNDLSAQYTEALADIPQEADKDKSIETLIRTQNDCDEDIVFLNYLEVLKREVTDHAPVVTVSFSPPMTLVYKPLEAFVKKLCVHLEKAGIEALGFDNQFNKRTDYKIIFSGHEYPSPTYPRHSSSHIQSTKIATKKPVKIMISLDDPNQLEKNFANTSDYLDWSSNNYRQCFEKLFLAISNFSIDYLSELEKLWNSVSKLPQVAKDLGNDISLENHQLDYSPFFVQRAQELALVYEMLNKPYQHITLILGAIGSGKSFMVQKLTHQISTDEPIVQVNGSSKENIQQLLSLLIQDTNGKQPLIVIDNLNNPRWAQEVMGHFSSAAKRRCLITTRNPRVCQTLRVNPIRLAAISIEDATQYLLERTSSNDEESARRVAEYLGCLPLALELSIQFCSQNGLSPKEYFDILSSEIDVLDCARSEGKKIIPSLHQQIGNCIDELKKQDPLTIEVLTSVTKDQKCSFTINDLKQLGSLSKFSLSKIAQGLGYLLESSLVVKESNDIDRYIMNPIVMRIVGKILNEIPQRYYIQEFDEFLRTNRLLRKEQTLTGF